MRSSKRSRPRGATTARLGAVAVALSALLAAGNAPAAAQEPLTVYASLPQVGASKARSADVVLGMRMALADRGGRAAGHPVTLVALNDGAPRTGQWDPGRTARNARRAVRDETSVAYLGELNSGASVVSSPIT